MDIKMLTKEKLDEMLKHNELTNVAKQLDTTVPFIRQSMKGFGLPDGVYYRNYRENYHKFNHHFFSNIDSETKAYWLGFIMADGCIVDKSLGHLKLSIDLSQIDEIQLMKFKQDIECSNNLYYNNKRQSVSILLSSNILCNDLIKLGCTPRKSLTLKFPEIDKSLLNHFIRGYFDGDGCAFIDKHHNVITSNQAGFGFVGTKLFLESLIQKLALTYPKLQQHGNIYAFNASGNVIARKFYNYLYQDATIFLDRKKAVFDNHFKFVDDLNKYGSRPRISTKSNKTTNFKGVYKTKTGQWYAYIHHKSKRIHLGSFKTDIDAAKAYNNKAKEIYHDMAILNIGI